MIKIDMHLHTNYSWDSATSVEGLNKRCSKLNLIPIITDHNTIEGAKKFVRKYKYGIIGEEISTQQGEIIAIFLKSKIPPGLTLHETVKLIKKQSAVSYIPHPFDRLRKKRLLNLQSITHGIDIIEVFNSRTLQNKYNREADDYADKHKLLKGVGSDAHFPSEIGNSFIELKSFRNKHEFIKNLKIAKFHCKKSSFLVHPLTKLKKIHSKILGKHI